MTLLHLIRVEEKATLSEMKEFCKINGTTRWVLYTDLSNGTSGLMPEYQLNQNYENTGKMKNGKYVYLERIKVKEEGE